MGVHDYFAELTPDHPVAALAPDLVAAFRAAGYTNAGLHGYLGPEATEALYRGEPAAVDVACGNDQLGDIIRAFVLHQPVERDLLVRSVGADLTAGLCAAGVALADAAARLQVCLDIRPHVISGRDVWVFSDVDAALVSHVPGPDHVLGVGSASLSLIRSTPTSAVDSVLDLGTGSGVQLLGQLDCANRIVGTDVHPRALALAQATVNGALAAASASENPAVELRQGSWFAPVAGETFDRIVANPPFVVGLPEVGHVYRDSGLNLDGASELVVSQAIEHLNPGGTAHILAAWVHCEEETWQQRVASWLPSTGVAAWVIQRDVADPSLYVATWLKDESVDVRSAAGQDKARLWLEHLRDHGVYGIGFGFVALQRIGDDEPSDVLAEYMPQAFDDPLGPEVEEYFARVAWLRNLAPGELEASRFRLRPGLAKEDISLPNQEEGGFARAVLRLTRTEGPRWSHEVDEHLAAIVAGLRPDGLSLHDTVDIYAAFNDLDADALLQAVTPAIVDLVRHGLVLPAQL